MKFNFFGTKIYISFLFAATLSFMLATDRTGLVIPTLFAVLIHEAGHLIAMWAGDCAPKEIRLIPASVQIVESLPRSQKVQAGIVLCGPLANIAVSMSLYINFYLSGSNTSLRFCLLNAVLAAFNLLPVSGLDGGRLLCMLICKFADLYTALKVVRIITAVLSVSAFFAGVLLILHGKANISLFIVALYLAVCAVMKR